MAECSFAIALRGVHVAWRAVVDVGITQYNNLRIIHSYSCSLNHLNLGESGMNIIKIHLRMGPEGCLVGFNVSLGNLEIRSRSGTADAC